MLLEVRGLCKEYRRGETAFFAVDNADLDIPAGDFVNIIGRSGSGKTTFLAMLAGLLAPSSGSITIDGIDTLRLKDRQMSSFRNSRIGYIPQGAGLLSNLSVFDNVRLPFYLDRRDGDASGRAMFLLEKTGVAHLAQMPPSRLSGGELRRVLIARALMNEPDILLADEPTSDLDGETTKEIMEVFAAINKSGVTIVLVTHEADSRSFGTRTLTMTAGKLSQIAPPVIEQA
jgi:putative ABC transport system ATP-binding protein